MSEQDYDNEATTNDNEPEADQTNNAEQEEKWYAGKFKSVEDLEEGYKNAAKVFQEKQELEKQLEQYKAPEEYQKPESLTLDDNTVKAEEERARQAGLTQNQFDQILKQKQKEFDQHTQNFNQKCQEIGENQVNTIKDHIERVYPPSIQDKMLRETIMNDQARQEVLNQRERTLNSTAPGISVSEPASGSRITKEDIAQARDKFHKTRSLEDQKRYLSLIQKKASER